MSHEHLDTAIFGEPPPNEPRRRRPQRQPRGTGRRMLVILLAIVLVGGATLTAFTILKPIVSSLIGGGGSEGEDFAGPGEGDVSVTVNQGDSGEAIASTLKAAGVVKSRTAYLDASAADPQQSAKIQGGTYTLKKGMRAIDAFSILADPSNRSVSGVTIREGLWASETYAALSKATGVPVADYEKAAKDPAAIGLPAAAEGVVEGYLFPSTYEFDKGTPAATQLKQMIAKTLAELKKATVQPKDYTRILTVASIIEAEARRDEDRPKVARVLENRVAAKMPLQLDSTVSYGVKRRNLTTTDAERADDNPYNTYKHAGLPVGPIANPGAASIQAAISPAEGPWLYFVAINPATGETAFATTFAEHQKNVRIFQEWCQAHKGQC
ncbi:MAG: endolytic transglycosylase MltG [Knoellia sp.]